MSETTLSVEEEIEVIRKRQDEQEAAWERIREIDANTDECGNISNQEHNESERLRRRAEELRHEDEMYMDCDYRLMLDHIAALRAQVAELTRELEQLRRDNKAITVAVKIAPEWQGNYAYDFDETLVIVDNEYQDGELFYQVVGRFGRGWIEASHLRLTT